MKTLLLFLLFLQFAPPPQPAGPIMLPTSECAADDPCPDPSRPWMRGRVEKWCGRTPEQVKAMQEKAPGTTILVCACVNMCNPNDPHADETGGVTVDARCQTRCNPKNCQCPRKCDS